MREFEFATVDVFCRRPLEGNPLAVIPDARGLTDPEMLAVAREFNLAETTFVFPRDEATERARGVRTRIFTKREEMPFAGHPTLGTAAVLRARGSGDLVTLELNVGAVPVRFFPREGRAFGEMTQIDPVFGAVHERARVAEALGIPAGEINDSWPIRTVSTGNPVAIVPFLHLSALQRWVPDWARLERYLSETDAKFVYAVCPQTVAPEAQIHARMPFYGGDDPATGSAAGPLAAWMVMHRLAAPGSVVQVEQGLEINRPSRLYASAQLVGGRPTDVRVGGFFEPVLRGTLSLP